MYKIPSELSPSFQILMWLVTCCICFSEVSSTLRQLGCDTESEDDLLEQIRSEVKRLGTQQSIKRDLVCLEQRDTTDYVIKRPQLLPSTRDYLTDKHRYIL